jgi:cytochrome c553
MRRLVGLLAVAVLSMLSLSTGAISQEPAGTDQSWLFPAKVELNRPPVAEEPGPKQLPGSSKTYTQEQVDNLASPPDWYPDDHVPAPVIVTDGTANKGFACGSCHLMSGYGHPESSDLAGLPAGYIVQQMADFRSGARKEPIRMQTIAQATSEADTRQAAEFFANLKPGATPWVETIEADSVPKTYLGPGRMRFVHPDGGTEPIANRIIMVPQDVARARLRDPRSGFIAYVPVGSIARGKALVETGGGGKTVACSICHGDSLQGSGNVPRLAGHHPIYTARQLYLFKDGRRNGADASLMQRPVAQLTDEDIVAISAYLGSLAH